MVFGTTYCAISHLPIEDGNKCILIPLGFRMQYDFDRYNKADINCFAYLYTFIREEVEVIFGGNVSQITYFNDTKYHKKGSIYEEYEMFILVHYKFYQKIISESTTWMHKTINRLPLYNSVQSIWEQANEFSDMERAKLQGKLNRKKITEENFSNLYLNIPTPEWMIKIYKVSDFMSGMGIPPHPIWCNDQHQKGKLYEKFRSDCIK